MDKLIFKRGGEIVRVSGVWNETTEEWTKKEEVLDFVPTAYERHDLSLELEDGLTLRDVFLLVNKHLDIWGLLLGNWCKEFITAGLTREKEKEKEDDLVIDHLRVYTYMEITKYKDGEFNFTPKDRLDFDGRGTVKKGDHWMKAGEEINIGINLTPIQNLLDYPIKIDKEYELWYHDYSIKTEMEDEKWKNPNKLFEFKDLEASLFQFLYTIFWELSFHGGPEDTKQFRDSLNKSVKV